MTLYHGSTIDIPCIDLSLSKPNKDFGRAFYLSDDRQQALEMAQFRAEFEETEPVVNVYEFDEDLFQQFRYKRFEAYTEEWAHFVYDHRTEPHGRTLHDYDIVYGPIANDRVGAQIARYKTLYFTMNTLIDQLGWYIWKGVRPTSSASSPPTTCLLSTTSVWSGSKGKYSTTSSRSSTTGTTARRSSWQANCLLPTGTMYSKVN